MGLLALVRHGESAWNRDSRFTGWLDAPITERGKVQAREAGSRLRNAGLSFDLGYTSVLSRAITSLWEMQTALGQPYLPVVRTWRLNDRHYGALTGEDKETVLHRFGHQQFQSWRRGFSTAPPPLDKERQVELLNQLGPMGSLSLDDAPLTESLSDTWNRLQPVWSQSISPALRLGQRVLVVSHGNALRALIKHIEQMSERQVENLELSNGQCVLYRFEPNADAVGVRISTAPMTK